MKKFRVHYLKRERIECYVEVEAEDEIAAANKSQELIIQSDDHLVEMPETHKVETNELGYVEEVEETE